MGILCMHAKGTTTTAAEKKHIPPSLNKSFQLSENDAVFFCFVLILNDLHCTIRKFNLVACFGPTTSYTDSLNLWFFPPLKNIVPLYSRHSHTFIRKREKKKTIQMICHEKNPGTRSKIRIPKRKKKLVD